MSEPTTAVVSTGVFAMIGNGLTWAAGAIGLVTLGKIIIDYLYMRKDVKEMKEDQKKMDKKMDKLLECSQNNSKQIAVLNERTEEK